MENCREEITDVYMPDCSMNVSTVLAAFHNQVVRMVLGHSLGKLCLNWLAHWFEIDNYLYLNFYISKLFFYISKLILWVTKYYKDEILNFLMRSDLELFILMLAHSWNIHKVGDWYLFEVTILTLLMMHFLSFSVLVNSADFSSKLIKLWNKIKTHLLCGSMDSLRLFFILDPWTFNFSSSLAFRVCVLPT